jgi:hypothetical protein
MLKLLMAMMHASAPVTYTTLNPVDKGVSITLSGGNLTASASFTGLARSIKSIGAAEHKYWECTVGATGSRAALAFGVCNGSAGVNDWPGNSANGISYRNTGSIYSGGAVIATFGVYVNGDVIGWESNRNTGDFSIYLNGVLQGTLAGYGSVAIYPCYGATSSAATATYNFGPSMAYSIPAGASLITA